jgi:hypothetical protein
MGVFDKLAAMNPFGPGGAGERGDARRALEEAQGRWAGIRQPTAEELALRDQWLSDLEASTIDGTPDIAYEGPEAERARAINMDGTAFDQVSTDPRLKDQQMASLAALKGLADSGGMTAEDQANLNRIQNQSAQADRGRRDAILQNMQARGMGGSGNELLAQLQSSQAATDRQAQQGLDIAGMAQNRALQAMMQGGELAGNVRDQDFGEQARIAQARDAVNQFNAQNLTQANQFNAGQGNNMAQFNAGNQMQAAQFKNLEAQKFNAGQTQSANQFNTAGKQQVQSDTAKHNANIPQQQFQNAATVAGGQAAIDQAKAGMSAADAARKDDKLAQGIGGAMQLAGGAAMMMSDERAKKNKHPVQEVDLDMFLASIQPKKFKYKDPANGDGDFTGVMAQDLLKSAIGREAVVQDDTGTLGYDKDKMQGIMLAALKHLSNKIDKKGA